MSGAMVPMASIDDMQEWACALMASRAPDFVIGNDYLRRWWVIPRNPFANVYLHQIRKSDDDRALHDHPWPNTSFLISGVYVEHTPEGRFVRQAGDVVSRPAEALHRLEVAPGSCAVSLFITGPKVREWGFECPHGWVHWKDFTHPDDSSKVGRGCGEHNAPSPVTAHGQERVA
ncbi:cupin domain-containing protein [Alteriqipengyuania sp.]|uniref:cupin domain-containing protein n=1 Tax=Alteriqipengyuania sp. TaxID=2800692 RepID=UPI003513DBF2